MHVTRLRDEVGFVSRDRTKVQVKPAHSPTFCPARFGIFERPLALSMTCGYENFAWGCGSGPRRRGRHGRHSLLSFGARPVASPALAVRTTYMSKLSRIRAGATRAQEADQNPGPTSIHTGRMAERSEALASGRPYDERFAFPRAVLVLLVTQVAWVRIPLLSCWLYFCWEQAASVGNVFVCVC